MSHKLSNFAQGIYDVLGMNTSRETQEGFFNKYVQNDEAFMIDQFTDEAKIYFDDYTITISPKNGNGKVFFVNGKKVIPMQNATETSDIYVSDEKLGIDEICLTLTFLDGYAQDKFGNLMTYPKVGDLTDEQIEQIDEYTGGRVSDSGCVTPNDVCLLFGKLVDFGIMDTAQNHNEDLVKEINLKWLRFREEFRPILIALYTRDIDEITDSDAFQIPKWKETNEYEKGVVTDDWDDYNKMALADMIARWSEFANNYLMHIADDQDLVSIIKFVRYDVCEDAKHDGFLTRPKK